MSKETTPTASSPVTVMGADFKPPAYPNDDFVPVNDDDLYPGTTYVMFIPPGWLIAGTLKYLTATKAVFTDVAYLESAGSSTSLAGGVAMANNAKELQAACPTAHMFPRTTFRKDGILFHMPCLRDVKPLCRSQEAAAIKGTK